MEAASYEENCLVLALVAGSLASGFFQEADETAVAAAALRSTIKCL